MRNPKHSSPAVSSRHNWPCRSQNHREPSSGSLCSPGTSASTSVLGLGGHWGRSLGCNTAWPQRGGHHRQIWPPTCKSRLPKAVSPGQLSHLTQPSVLSANPHSAPSSYLQSVSISTDVATGILALWKEIHHSDAAFLPHSQNTALLSTWKEWEPWNKYYFKWFSKDFGLMSSRLQKKWVMVYAASVHLQQIIGIYYICHLCIWTTELCKTRSGIK